MFPYKSFIEKEFGEENIRQSGNEIAFPCPFCGTSSRKHLLNVEKGLSHCWRATCGWSGSFVSFIMEYKGLSFPQAHDFIQRKGTLSLTSRNIRKQLIELRNKLVLYDELYGESNISVSLSNLTIDNGRILKWLVNDRKYSKKWARKINDNFISGVTSSNYDKPGYQNRVIFKIECNNHKSYLAYDITGKNKKYKTLNPGDNVNSQLIFPYNYIKGRKILILVEGVFDAIRLISWGFTAGCLFGTSLSAYQIMLINSSGFKEVVFCFDGDAIYLKGKNKGKRRQDVLLERYGDEIEPKISTIRLKKNDPDDYVRVRFEKAFTKRRSYEIAEKLGSRIGKLIR